ACVDELLRVALLEGLELELLRVGSAAQRDHVRLLLGERTLEPLDLQIVLVGRRGRSRRGGRRCFAAPLARRWLFSLKHIAGAKLREKRMRAQATAALK